MLPEVKACRFLSIQAQDFIEDGNCHSFPERNHAFLSIQAQDFIEETSRTGSAASTPRFLSIQAQDFIEDPATCQAKCRTKDS